jgi:hypothetical protein
VYSNEGVIDSCASIDISFAGCQALSRKIAILADVNERPSLSGSIAKTSARPHNIWDFDAQFTTKLTEDGWGREEFPVLSKDHGEHDVGLHADIPFCDGSYPDTVRRAYPAKPFNYPIQ